jgi:hypothetical protein
VGEWDRARAGALLVRRSCVPRCVSDTAANDGQPRSTCSVLADLRPAGTNPTASSSAAIEAYRRGRLARSSRSTPANANLAPATDDDAAGGEPHLTRATAGRRHQRNHRRPMTRVSTRLRTSPSPPAPPSPSASPSFPARAAQATRPAIPSKITARAECPHRRQRGFDGQLPARLVPASSRPTAG